MKVKICINREAAIVNGLDRYGDVVVDIDPATLSTADRMTLSQSPEREGVTDLTASPVPCTIGGAKLPPMPELAEPDVAAFLDWRRESFAEHRRALEAAKAEEVRIADAYLAWAQTQPVDAFLRRRVHGELEAALPVPPYGCGVKPLPTSRYGEDPAPRLRAALAEPLALAAALAVERNALVVKAKAEREAEHERAEQAKKAQLEAWVRDRMDDNAQGRYRLGLLPQEEILDGMRAEAFRALDDFDRYGKIRVDDLPHTDDCEGSYGRPVEMSCETRRATGIDASIYDAYARVEQEAPQGAELEVLVHVCSCDACDAELHRFSVRVALTVGAFDFTREYALGEYDVMP